MVKRTSNKQVPPVSDAEWEVMEVVWASPTPCTASQIVSVLTDRRRRSPQTVKTLLSRLVAKNALAFDADGNRYLYRANVRREDCVRAESRSFLARVFGNQPGPMLCRLVHETPLSPDEIDQLRKLLDNKGRGR